MTLTYHRRKLRAWFQKHKAMIVAFLLFFLLLALSVLALGFMGYLYVVIKNAEGV